MKLGEMLVSAGKLTPAQVEETLKGQAIFGGKFGTNLVEMGYLDEHDLAHFLSRKTGVPHASPGQLMDIPPQVLKLIPEETVRKYRVIPIGVNNRKLIVAMADPSDFAAIDEISFITGYIVLPVITPELRLVNALEKHYNIKREMRYIKVQGGGRNRARMTQPSPEPAKQAAPVKPAESTPPVLELEEADVLELPLLSELSLDDLDDPHLVSLEPAAPLPAAPLFPPQPAVSQPATPTAQQPMAPQSIAPPPPAPDYSFQGILKGFTQAENRDGVAELIVSYACQQFERAAIFLLKDGKAKGWAAQCAKKVVPNFGQVEIDLNEPSILRVVAESKSFYIGPMPMTPSNTDMLAALGGGNPVNNLVVPVMMVGRVVGILYVDGGNSRLDDKVADFQRLVTKASMAFEILILKSKILLT